MKLELKPFIDDHHPQKRLDVPPSPGVQSKLVGVLHNQCAIVVVLGEFGDVIETTLDFGLACFEFTYRVSSVPVIASASVAISTLHLFEVVAKSPDTTIKSVPL